MQNTVMDPHLIISEYLDMRLLAGTKWGILTHTEIESN